MPLTFPSHAAAVLPIKLARRRRFDGVALVVGSGAPDYVYPLVPYVAIDAHTWWGIGWFCVPATMVLTGLCRLGAPAVARHLARAPGGRLFALGDYASLGWHRHPTWLTLLCAALGATSHRLWDLCTHASLDGGATRIAFVNDVTIGGRPLWSILQQVSTIVGGVAAVWMFRLVARKRWLRDPELGEAPYRPRRFWGAAATVWALGILAQPFLAGFTEPTVLIVRLMAVACLGLLAGAAAAAGQVRKQPRHAAGRAIERPQ